MSELENLLPRMRACDQSSIFSTGGKFRPDYGLLLELHALTLVARSSSYVLLNAMDWGCGRIFESYEIFGRNTPTSPAISWAVYACYNTASQAVL